MIAYNVDSTADQGKPGDANYVAGTDGWVDPITKYGFTAGKPCVYLKLNKIFGLKNINYKNAEEDLPEKMPDTLKAQIKAAGYPDQTWVECHGEYPADVEALR